VKASLVTRAVGVGAVTVLGLIGCGSNSNGSTSNGSSGGGADCASGTLSGQGSSFQNAMEEQWVADFTNKCSGAQVTYTAVGSGAGIEQFGSGTTDFAGSDVVMDADQQKAADKACGSTAIHIPVTAGGIAVIYNLAGVDNLQLSASTIAKIFDGAITTWDNAAIKADNPGVKLPSTAIKMYHRADDSGTTGVFSKFLDTVAHADWTLGTATTLNWKSGQGATGSDGVAQGVKNTDGGIGYAEFSYAKQGGLSYAKVKGAGNDYAELTGANVGTALDTGFSVTGTGDDLAGTLDFNKMQGYPISTVSYVIACSTYGDAAKGTLVKDYLKYALGAGQGAAAQLGFAPLPSALDSKATKSADSIS
jgi:phosphate transport system substrate-binding protein